MITVMMMIMIMKMFVTFIIMARYHNEIDHKIYDNKNLIYKDL